MPPNFGGAISRRDREAAQDDGESAEVSGVFGRRLRSIVLGVDWGVQEAKDDMKITAINYISRDCLVELNRAVDGMIEDGWQPFGSVSVCSFTYWDRDCDCSCNGFEYIQAMVPDENKLAPTN